MTIRHDDELAGLQAVGRLVARTIAHMRPHHEPTVMVRRGEALVLTAA